MPRAVRYPTREENIVLSDELPGNAAEQATARAACASTRGKYAWLGVEHCIRFASKARGKIQSSRDIESVLFDLFGTSALMLREHFFVVVLGARNAVLGIAVVHVGGTTGVNTEVAMIFKHALLLPGAAAVIVGHNHPSGEAQPSPEDVLITKKLVEAGRILGIHVLDHVILAIGPGGQRTMFSFLDSGMMAAASR